MQWLSSEVEVGHDDHVQPIDQTAPDVAQTVRRAADAGADKEIIRQPNSSDVESVVAFGDAVADEPFQERSQFELADVFHLVPISVHNRHALLQTHADVAAQG